jgi:hypothetical protein
MTSFALPLKYDTIAKNFAFDVTPDHIYWTNGTRIYSSLINDSGERKVADRGSA